MGYIQFRVKTYLFEFKSFVRNTLLISLVSNISDECRRLFCSPPVPFGIFALVVDFDGPALAGGVSVGVGGACVCAIITILILIIDMVCCKSVIVCRKHFRRMTYRIGVAAAVVAGVATSHFVLVDPIVWIL